jgi:peptide/nickel transport system substrate-binding protein
MRKKVLPMLAVPAGLVLLVAQSNAPVPVRGGTLTVAMNVDPPMLDPTQSPSAEIARMTYRNVLEGLLGYDSRGRVAPVLATAVPKPTDNGLTYTFTLRKNVKFHDGSAFDATDVKAMFDRARDPKSGHSSPGYYASIASITITNPTTVVFKLSQIDNDFLYNMARSDSVITPSESLSAAGLQAMQTKPIGTGPFKVDAWNRGTSLRLVRNPNYYVAGLPYLDGVTFRFMGDDQNAKVAALRAGDIDVIGYNVPAEQANTLKADPQFKVVTGPSSGEITVSLNNQRKPFNDVRVRRAFTLAMNKKEIVDGAFFGFGTVIGSFNSPGQPYYIDLTNKYPYNPEQAKKLLADAGYASGLSVTFTVTNEYPIERRTAEVYAAQLQQIGVNARIELIPFNTWLTKVFTNKDYDMTIIGHAEAYDLDRYARDGYYFNWDNKAYKALYEKAQTTTDEAERGRLFRQMQTMLADQAPGIWAFSAPYIAATRANVYNWPGAQPVPNLNLAYVFKTK